MKSYILFLAIAFLSGCFGAEPQKSGKEGKAMPDFSLLLTDSTTWLHSRDILSGKPTVIFYFSPYCPHCKAQTKKITEEIDRLKDIPIYFISHYSISEIKNYYKEFQLAKYPNIVTGMDSGATLNYYFEIPGFPYTAIYKKDKTLSKTFIGKMFISNLLKATEE